VNWLPDAQNDFDVLSLVGSENSSLRFASMRDYRDCSGEDKAECLRHPMKPEDHGKSPTAPPPQTGAPVDTSVAPSSHNIPPTTGGDQQPSLADRTRAADPPYPGFNALMYSIDVFVPVIDFGQGSYWLPGHEMMPQSLSITPLHHDAPLGLLWLFYWLEIAAGWWYSTILVANLTGILHVKE
jgi:hypothetical protein